MKTQSNTLVKVYFAAILVIIPLVAAAWFTPVDFPMLLRQILLCGWGVGATFAAERLLFRTSWGEALRGLGFVAARRRAVIVALLVSLPMWLFLPLFAWFNGVPVHLQPNWVALLIGVVLVNGIAEEVIHRAFVFGHLRRERSFAAAAMLSALLFAAQHLYLVLSSGWTATRLAGQRFCTLARMRPWSSWRCPKVLSPARCCPTWVWCCFRSICSLLCSGFWLIQPWMREKCKYNSPDRWVEVQPKSGRFGMGYWRG